MENEKFSKRTKHIDICFHGIKHLKEESIIEFEYCPSKYMIADALAKFVPKSELQSHRMSMKLLSHPSEELKGECQK